MKKRHIGLFIIVIQCAVVHCMLFFCLFISAKGFTALYHTIIGCSFSLHQHELEGFGAPEKILIVGLVLLILSIGIYMRTKFFTKFIVGYALLIMDIVVAIWYMFYLISPLFRILWRLQ